MPQGEEGQVHINGNYGKLIITAPGNQGDPEQYYYEVTTRSGTDTGYQRTVGPVKSGEQYQLDHLPKGTYAVREYNYSGSGGFSVTVPKLVTSTRTITHTKENNPKINVFYNYKTGIPEDVVYAKVTFDEILGVAEGTKAQLGIKGTWTDSEGVEKGYKYSGTVGKINSINNRYLLPGSRILLARYDDNITSIRF